MKIAGGKQGSPFMVRTLVSALLLPLFLFTGSRSDAQADHADAFVQRAGTSLTLGGQPFRYSGPNVEWLGLEGYGPHDPLGPRYPSHFEIDDAFATAEEMGARVVRSQTMGDTVGCPLCIEPSEGQFNDAAFQSSDYALAAARKHGMKVIITLIGDCATCTLGGIGQYLAWEKKQNPMEFFTDAGAIAAFEKHIDAVLNHRNPLTGLRYKDDPTIMAWENCNMCGILAMFFAPKDAKAMANVASWVDTIGAHIKQVDARHLYLDTSGIFPMYAATLDDKTPDMVTFEYYPHWTALLGAGASAPTPATFKHDAALITGYGKAYIINEYGWDRTNWKTPEELQAVLDELAGDKNISGDGYWALQAHVDNFGFQAIPADSKDPAFAEHGECGEWWALYYPGVKTLVNTAEDMAARAQQLRAHAYAMAGAPVPKHMVPPQPVITSVVIGGLVAWRGSAGAVKYSVEEMDPGSTEWKTVCDKCATDADDPWIAPKAQLGAHFRVTAWNADGAASQSSDPR
jgi:mannan endo-1,4-beta-mannosidase